MIPCKWYFIKDSKNIKRYAITAYLNYNEIERSCFVIIEIHKFYGFHVLITDNTLHVAIV